MHIDRMVDFKMYTLYLHNNHKRHQVILHDFETYEFVFYSFSFSLLAGESNQDSDLDEFQDVKCYFDANATRSVDADTRYLNGEVPYQRAAPVTNTTRSILVQNNNYNSLHELSIVILVLTFFCCFCLFIYH